MTIPYYVAALLSGEDWGGNIGQPASVTYTFGGTASPLSASQQTAAIASFQAWANVANVTFVNAGGASEDINLAQGNLSSQGAAGLTEGTFFPGSPMGSMSHADITIDNSRTDGGYPPGRCG